MTKKLEGIADSLSALQSSNQVRITHVDTRPCIQIWMRQVSVLSDYRRLLLKRVATLPWKLWNVIIFKIIFKSSTDRSYIGPQRQIMRARTIIIICGSGTGRWYVESMKKTSYKIYHSTHHTACCSIWIPSRSMHSSFEETPIVGISLSLIHIWRCRRRG